MLLTKLHIPTPSKNLVHRSSLFDKLNAGLNRKLILVSAPAGFGKTSVVSDWINQKSIPAAWYSIDHNDNELVDFLSYIIMAIQGIQKDFGHSALELLNSPNQTSPESIVNLLINDTLSIEKDFCLVLDDFHLINIIAISNIVAYLVEHIPENAHVIIVTRSDPVLPLAKLRSQNQLVELRSSDLSFSTNDIYELFNKKLKIKLSGEEISALESKTEGWIAGLQLTALSIRGRENISDFIHNLKGDNRYIMDYLIEEVLKIQSEETKEFLLQTSILEQFSTLLCNAVLNRNDSHIILEELEKNNMFIIPLDNERLWYRYHHLFANLLKQRLQFKGQAKIEELHNNACDWFEQNNMYNYAIEHALKINNFEKAVQMLGETAEYLWETGHHSAIIKYGDLIPDEIIKKNIEFCLYYSWILISTGKIQKAEPFLHSAEENANRIINSKDSSEKDIEHHKKLRGKIAVAFALMYVNEMRSEEIIKYCKTAMDNLTDEDPLWYGWAWYSKARAEMVWENTKEVPEALNIALEYAKKSCNLYLISLIAIRIAYNNQRMGFFKSAFKTCSDLLEYMKESGYSQIAKAEWTFAGVFSMMAFVQYIWADFEGAAQSAKIAYDLSKNEANLSHKLLALLVKSSVLQGHGDSVGALEVSNELELIIKQNKGFPFFTPAFVSLKIEILSELDQIDMAEDFIKEYGLGIKEQKTDLNEFAYAAYARLLLKQNKLDDAESMLAELYNLAEAGKRIERLVELKILYAMLYKMKSNHEKAITALIEAMEFAVEENILIGFVENLKHIHDLLKDVFKIQATKKTNIPKYFIDNLKNVIERKEKLKKSDSEVDLSTREIDTLKLIAEGLNNQEIADKMFISLNTVKSHIKNIYIKLEVNSRTQAIVKASELEII
ncbi:LuxR C-terminal-related transcriptional regulator [Bacteroidota bacterium]